MAHELIGGLTVASIYGSYPPGQVHPRSSLGTALQTAGATSTAGAAQALSHQGRANAGWLAGVGLGRHGRQGWIVGLMVAVASVVRPRRVQRRSYTPEEMPGATRTAWALLGVKPGADRADLKKGYKKFVRTWHPDVQKVPDPEAASKFATVSKEYRRVMTCSDDLFWVEKEASKVHARNERNWRRWEARRQWKMERAAAQAAREQAAREAAGETGEEQPSGPRFIDIVATVVAGGVTFVATASTYLGVWMVVTSGGA